MRRSKNVTRALVVLGLLGVGRGASADDTGEIESLLDQSVVTTATRTSQAASVAPGLITVVTSDDMRRYGMHTLAEALGFLAHGVITGGDGEAGEVGARGTLLTGDGGDHFLLLLNGHVLNDPLSGGTNFGRGSGVPMELIDHLEVILGPGSVLYGNGAMLGIVNVVTKRAQAYDGVHAVAEGEFPAAGRLSAGVGHSFTFLGAPSEVTAAFEYFRAQPSVDYPRRFYLDPTTQTPAGFSSAGPPTGQWGGRATRATWSEAPSAYVRLMSGNFELALRGAMFGQGNPASELDFDNPLTFTKNRWASFDLTHHSWALADRRGDDAALRRHVRHPIAADRVVPLRLRGLARGLVPLRDQRPGSVGGRRDPDRARLVEGQLVRHHAGHRPARDEHRLQARLVQPGQRHSDPEHLGAAPRDLRSLRHLRAADVATGPLDRAQRRGAPRLRRTLPSGPLAARGPRAASLARRHRQGERLAGLSCAVALRVGRVDADPPRRQ